MTGPFLRTFLLFSGHVASSWPITTNRNHSTQPFNVTNVTRKKSDIGMILLI
jgi:hypothetical protein